MYVSNKIGHFQVKKLQHRDAYQHGQVTQLPSDEAVGECRRLRLIPL